MIKNYNKLVVYPDPTMVGKMVLSKYDSTTPSAKKKTKKKVMLNGSIICNKSGK